MWSCGRPELRTVVNVTIRPHRPLHARPHAPSVRGLLALGSRAGSPDTNGAATASMTGIDRGARVIEDPPSPRAVTAREALPRGEEAPLVVAAWLLFGDCDVPVGHERVMGDLWLLRLNRKVGARRTTPAQPSAIKAKLDSAWRATPPATLEMPRNVRFGQDERRTFAKTVRGALVSTAGAPCGLMAPHIFAGRPAERQQAAAPQGAS